MSTGKQEKLLGSKVVILCGEQSADFAVSHLIVAGVGRIIVARTDVTAANNNSEQAAGNPDVIIEEYRLKAASDNLEQFVQDSSVVLDASFDWQLKMRLSDACMRLSIPLIHSGTTGPRFQVFTMIPGKSACLRCALPKAGIDDFPLEPIAHVTMPAIAACTGALMALEAIKIITGLGVTQGNELWKLDGLSGELEIIRGLDRQRDCPDCGRG
jgi:Dinucleotide-utilizing enzymes involved in molybdopterin and thiamine biosynthesis family 2